MTRVARISIELLAPPLLGASPFLLMAACTGTFGMIPVVLLAGILGLSAGVAIGLSPRVPAAAEKALLFGVIGMFVGASTASIVRWKATRGGPP